MAKLGAVIAVIDQELVQAFPTLALRVAWDELVSVLALGPAPRTRAARRCGHRWVALEPLLP